jgi:chromosome partitioning protein
MKIITFLNEKGGTGKTTLSTHIAAGLALRGYRVVFIDADPQGNGTATFGVAKRGTFYDLCVRPEEMTWQKALIKVHPDVYSPPDQTSKGSLYVVAGNKETRNIPNMTSDQLIIKKLTMQLQRVVDFIIFDTSPTPSLLHASIMMASDHIIVPTDCEAYSAFEGLPGSIQHIGYVQDQLVRANLEGANLLAVIPNKYRAKTALHNEILNMLRDEYGDLVWDPMPLRVSISESQAMKQLLFGLDPSGETTQMLWQMVDKLLEKMGVKQ